MMSQERDFSPLVTRNSLPLAMVSAFAIWLAASSAVAQRGGPYIYPSKGQTQEQRQRQLEPSARGRGKCEHQPRALGTEANVQAGH
jgi:hypothetical protein